MTDLPRLLLCCFDVVPAPTAISRRLTEYVKGLSERYQVVVLTVKTPDHAHIERYQGARLLRVPVGTGDLPSRVQVFDRAVRRQLESEEYVMAHFFDPFGGYALCERRGDHGYKLVYDACSFPSEELPLVWGEHEANRRFIARIRRQELFCLMNADLVVVSNGLTADYVTGIGVPRERLQQLLPPVDLAPFARDIIGEPDGVPMNMLHLGNLSRANDLGLVLQAMAMAEASGALKLTIAGEINGALQAELETRAHELKLGDRVVFQDPVPHAELHKVLAAADVGLVTLSEVDRNLKVGSPLSRLGEYLAAGRPVIAADVPSARAVLPPDGVVTYRPGDAQQLAAHMTALATDVPRRITLGAKARSMALAWDAAKIRADLAARYVALSGTGARAVGDSETISPDEVTQLGRGVNDEPDTKPRLKRLEDPPSGTNKVVVDPRLQSPDASQEAPPSEVPAQLAPASHDSASHDSAVRHDVGPLASNGNVLAASSSNALPASSSNALPASSSNALPASSSNALPASNSNALPASNSNALPASNSNDPATTAPIVFDLRSVGLTPTNAAPAEPVSGERPALDPAQVTTDPRVPVVAEPARVDLKPAVPPAAAAPLHGAPPFRSSASQALPPPLPRSSASGMFVRPSTPSAISAGPIPSVPPPLPRTASGVFPVAPPPLPRTQSGTFATVGALPPPRSSASGLVQISFGQIASGSAAPSRLKAVAAPVEAIDDSEIQEADALEEPEGLRAADDAREPEVGLDEAVFTVDSDASPPPSAIDPWLAQLVFGYCPPESNLFDRHTPPTTMPGRDT